MKTEEEIRHEITRLKSKLKPRITKLNMAGLKPVRELSKQKKQVLYEKIKALEWVLED